ncbi:helix-turn-helix domain-containing protein [Martelella sp. FOR1707]
MTYRHSMLSHTKGIRPVAPVQWRGLDGLVGVYWEAEGDRDANAYYLSPDPRIVIFFNDVSDCIRVSNRNGAFSGHERPLTQAIYVPAGVPMWTQFTARHRFSHLDLHLHEDRMLRFIAPSIGASAARAVLRRPAETHDIGPMGTLAGMIVDEVANPARHPLYAESLVGSLATALLDIPADAGKPASGGRITKAQMNRLLSRFEASPHARMTVAEMAETVGLSESWFSEVFRQTTGKTPLQWQLARRVERAKDLLVGSDISVADAAAELGFSDQAHLTRVFRQVTGETPAAWRKTALPSAR